MPIDNKMTQAVEIYLDVVANVMFSRPLTLPWLAVWSTVLLPAASDRAAVLNTVMGVLFCARFKACKQIRTETKPSNFSDPYMQQIAFESPDSEASLNIPPLSFFPSSA